MFSHGFTSALVMVYVVRVVFLYSSPSYSMVSKILSLQLQYCLYFQAQTFSELCFKGILCSSNILSKMPTDNYLQKWQMAHAVYCSVLFLGSKCLAIGGCYVSRLTLSPTVVL